ncbi:MAG: ABC transporter permease [Pseudonocardiales bacterium]|nr:ABC transporter permease [Pseudonocardiales bacterium]
MAAPVTAAQDEYLGEHHVYKPHKAGLPPLGRYISELWRRRTFVRELSRAELKAQNYQTVFGQLWLILNPLLNATVYFFLVDILSSGSKRAPNYITHLLSGIFAYTFFSGGVSQAAGSVGSSGKLILNTAFPRLLLPLTEIVIAFFRFLPTLPVLAAIILLNNRSNISWTLLLTVPIFGLLVLFTAGLGFICATLQVYNTDFKNLLPYLLRLGLYMTPILWFADSSSGIRGRIATFNPLSPIFELWSDAIVRGGLSPWETWLRALLYSVVLFVVGFVVYVSREREYAVRL